MSHPADRPFVTLAVKAYRQESLVREAIESVFAQTYPNLEIILSDDCSPDGTFRVMQEMAATYDGPHRVRLNRNSNNLGVVGHENRLWELASGRLFAHCAGDDVAEPERIAKLVAAWEAGSGKVLLVHSAVMRIDAQGRELEKRRPDRRVIDNPSPVNLARLRRNHIGATALQDRRLYDRFGPIPMDCGVEDGVQLFRAALLGEVSYVDEPLVLYRVGGLSDQPSESPGRYYLRGNRMTGLVWLHANLKCFIRDLHVAGHPKSDEIESICREFVESSEVEIITWKAGSLTGRIRLLPRATALALKLGDPKPLLQTLKHILGPIYIMYHDWRDRA